MSETRVALVSGANRGIGLEIVRQLSRRGLITALAARDRAKGEEAAASLRSEGLEVPVITLDVAEPESCAAAVAETRSMLGRLDVLINNAGIFIDSDDADPSTVLTVTPATFEQTMRTNVLGPLILIKAAAPVMQENGYGRIVNLSSGLGQLSDMGGGRPAYRISKAALNALTRTAAGDLAAANIKVNAMCPGWVRTDMGGPHAERSVEKGAETAVWLATLGEDGPTGGLFRDMKPIHW